MKEKTLYTIEEARQIVNEWVEIFNQNGIHLEVVNVTTVPVVDYEDEYFEPPDYYDEECFIQMLREGKYYDVEKCNADSNNAVVYVNGSSFGPEDYVCQLSCLGLAKTLSTLERWVNYLEGIEIEWILCADATPITLRDSPHYMPDADEDFYVVSKYLSNLDGNLLEAFRMTIRSKISHWDALLEQTYNL